MVSNVSPTPPAAAPQQRPTVPIVLGGRFWLRRVASIGDTGVSFFAIDQASAGRPCVVRFPHPWWLRAGGATEAWLAGWREVARSPHACHAKVYAIDDSPTLPFVVHEWVPGVDLATIMRARIAAGQILPWRFALAAAWIMADALFAAHQNAQLAGVGEYAGGLGPHRLRVGENGRVVLTARFAEAAVQQLMPAPSNAGEYAYRAPEAVRTGAATAMSDAWSIALFLDHAAAGWNRFERASISDTAEAILDSADERVNQFVPEDCLQVISSSLCSDPSLRSGVTAEMVSQLGQLVAEAGGMPTAEEWADLARQVRPREWKGHANAGVGRAALSELITMIRGTHSTSSSPQPVGGVPALAGSAAWAERANRLWFRFRAGWPLAAVAAALLALMAGDFLRPETTTNHTENSR